MNDYKETSTLKNEIRYLRLTISTMHEHHNQEVQRLKNEILKPKCKLNDTQASWKDAMRVACLIYDNTPDQIISHNRKQHILYGRHLFCYLCRKELQMTFKSIGRILNRDHSTVINAIYVYENLVQYDRRCRQNWRKAITLLGDYLQEKISNEHNDFENATRGIANAEKI